MKGVSSSSFEPNTLLTRAQLVMILWNMEKNPKAYYVLSFIDVRNGKWYTEAVRWAQSIGIVSGYDKNTFGPEDKITREQLAAILMRYGEYKKLDVSKRADLTKYTDKDTVSKWARESIEWAVAIGIISGRTQTTIVPKDNATRAEAACMIQRFCEAENIMQ